MTTTSTCWRWLPPTASVGCGPPGVNDREALAAVLRGADRAARRGQWLRGVGYHESVAGDLDRHVLDEFVAERPVRLQHRSGHAWFLNSAALAAAGLDGTEHPPGVDVDDATSPDRAPVRARRLAARAGAFAAIPTLRQSALSWRATGSPRSPMPHRPATQARSSCSPPPSHTVSCVSVSCSPGASCWMARPRPSSSAVRSR